VAQITAPANQLLRVLEARCTFDGANSTAIPAKAEIGRPSTTGTLTATTMRKRDPGRPETPQTSGGINASAEPNWAGCVDETLYCPVYGGMYHYLIPFDSTIRVPGGTRWGVRFTAQSPVDVSTTFVVDE
jgi:hypothetical protein